MGRRPRRVPRARAVGFFPHCNVTTYVTNYYRINSQQGQCLQDCGAREDENRELKRQAAGVPSDALPQHAAADARNLKRRSVAEETVRVKKEQLDEAAEMYEERDPWMMGYDAAWVMG